MELNSWQDLETVLNSDEQVFLVDTRSQAEYERGYIPGAQHIRHAAIADNLPTDNKDDLIILYCEKGVRSGQAFRTLTSLGYTNVVNFGGINRWKGEIIR